MIYQPSPIGRICKKCNEWKPRARLVKEKRCLWGVHALCLDCVAARIREDRQKNPLKYRIYERKFRKEHPDRYRTYQRSHNEQRNAGNRRRRALNPQHARDYHNRWRKKNRELVRRYEQATNSRHPDRVKQKSQVRRSRKHNLPSEFTEKHWLECLQYFNNRCAYCGRPQGLWHSLSQDHFIPVKKEGGYIPGNIVPACHGIDGCNESKHDKDAVDWLTAKYGKRTSKLILQRIFAYFQWVEHSSALPSTENPAQVHATHQGQS